MELLLSFEAGTDGDHMTTEQFDFVSYLKDTNIKIGCLMENSDDGKPILKWISSQMYVTDTKVPTKITVLPLPISYIY